MTVSQFIGGRATAEVEYLGQGPATSSGAGSVMDFSGVDYGAAEQGRVVAIPVFWSTDGSANSIVSATIGGQTAQIDVQQFVDVPLAKIYTGIISAVVDSGTSGAAQITFSGSVANNLVIHPYRIVGLVEYPTITDSDSAQASGGGDTSLFVQTKAGGVALTAGFARNSGTAYTLTGATEDYDYDIFSSIFRQAGGSYESSADEAAHEIRWQNANNNGALIAVSYR